jgi:hypothetical protein
VARVEPADGLVWQLDDVRRSYQSTSELAEALAVTPDGEAVYFTSRRVCVERWTLSGVAETLRACAGPTSHPNLLALSADGAVLVAGRERGGFDVWRGRARTATALGDDRVVAGLALAHDGRRLAVVEQDGATRVYDLTTGGAQLLASPGLSEVYHRAIGISPDGARVVWGEARGIGVVEVPGGAPRRIEGGAGEVRELVVAADGQTGFDRHQRWWCGGTYALAPRPSRAAARRRQPAARARRTEPGVRRERRHDHRARHRRRCPAPRSWWATPIDQRPGVRARWPDAGVGVHGLHRAAVGPGDRRQPRARPPRVRSRWRSHPTAAGWSPSPGTAPCRSSSTTSPAIRPRCAATSRAPLTSRSTPPRPDPRHPTPLRFRAAPPR